MYSKGPAKTSKHEWICSATSIGTPSYIYVRVFNFLHRHGTNTSFVSRSLGREATDAGTILQIHRAHLLFSFQGFGDIQRQITQLPGGLGPLENVILGKESSILFFHFQQNQEMLRGISDSLPRRYGDVSTSGLVAETRDEEDGDGEVEYSD
jgi:hypothetical protein